MLPNDDASRIAFVSNKRFVLRNGFLFSVLLCPFSCFPTSFYRSRSKSQSWASIFCVFGLFPLLYYPIRRGSAVALCLWCRGANVLWPAIIFEHRGEWVPLLNVSAILGFWECGATAL